MFEIELDAGTLLLAILAVVGACSLAFGFISADHDYKRKPKRERH